MMKKNIIFLFVILLQMNCWAQNWAKNSSVWYYDQTDYGPPFNTSYIIFESIGDTIINGDSAIVLNEKSITINDTTSTKLFMKSENNRVFVFVSSSNSFELLYDFNVLAGDTFHTYCRDSNQDVILTIQVDSVSQIDINGNIRKVQYVSQLNSLNYNCQMVGSIIENIGWTGFMFPMSTIADPPYGGSLRCYEDNIIGLFKNVSYDCDYITNVEELKFNKYIQIYPNPTNNKIKIQANNIEKIEIKDLRGINIYNDKINEIDLSSFSKGIYIVKVTTTKGYEVSKIILQ